MTSSRSYDVIVVGGGIVALAAARALAARGQRVFLSAPEHSGTASPLAAGVLGPTIDPAEKAAFAFSAAARDAYVPFSASVLEETGIDIQLELAGVLRVTLSEGESDVLRLAVSDDAHWLTPSEVRGLEPALAPCVGALFHYRDGIVANDRVHAALRVSTRRNSRIRWTTCAVTEVQADDVTVSVRMEDSSQVSAPVAVIAAGAWSAGIAGLPSPPLVLPLRGQMVAVTAVGLTRAVYGAGGYLTPRRDGRILSGSTQEQVGFDAGTTPIELDRLEQVARTLLPTMAPMDRCDAWAGLRPMSPDGLPIIDRDPKARSLIYATGHSRNGILMGPLTAQAVCALALGESFDLDLSPFSATRFETNQSK